MLWKEWVQIKNLENAGKAHNNIYIYSTPLQRVESVYSATYTDASLKNRFVNGACNLFVAGVVFCTQNLIRDG